MNVYEPGRAKYRSQKKNEETCPFCDKKNIKKQQCESLSGKYWRVMVNKYPYMDGNLMIIPKRHVRDVSELESDEWNEFQKVLIDTQKKLSKIFVTEDFNIGLNIGGQSGASIEHLHWQIIPRKAKILNSANIFADIHILTVLPDELKKTIDKK